MKRTLALFVLFASAALSAQTPSPYKNVQYLTDLTPTQLQRAMNMMRGSLGVHCDYCHVNKNDKWDWASDEKQEKKTARNMIAMTAELNTKFFNGRPQVSCFSCHRGSIHPVNIVTLPQAQPPFPTPEEPRPKLPARDEIVAKYAAAIGKVDPAALTSITMKGERESATGNKANIEVTQKGSNLRVSSPEFVNVLTPGGGWISEKDKAPREMSASQVEHGTELSNALRFVAPQDIPAEARVTRKDKVGDREAYVVQSAINDRVRQRLYFDAENGLLLRRVLLSSTPIGQVPLQVDYSDYRDVGGFKMPFTVRLDSADPWIGATRHYSEIHVGAKIDDSAFVMPKP